MTSKKSDDKQKPGDDHFTQENENSGQKAETGYRAKPGENNGDDFIDKEQLEEAYQKIQALQAELDHTKDNALRALADAENTRKRAAREKEDAVKYAISSFARDLLEVADNFRRGIETFPEDLRKSNEQLDRLLSGFEAVEKEMLKIFEKHGIKKLEPEGEIFDPNYHEVMFEIPAPGNPGGTVIQLIEPGYMLHDRLLRPARVGVAKGDDGAGEDPGARLDTEA
jgi:molecular chaperone GrpE